MDVPVIAGVRVCVAVTLVVAVRIAVRMGVGRAVGVARRSIHAGIGNPVAGVESNGIAKEREMRIGDLARMTDTSVESIRYYEREELLPAPARTSANYRSYDEQHVRRLMFIRRCRALDMALDEIRTLLGCIDRPGGDCSVANALLDEHLGHVRRRIAELRRLETELRELRAQCASPRSADACGILNGLSQGGVRARPRAGPHRHDDLHRY